MSSAQPLNPSPGQRDGSQGYRRIATEEAFVPRELMRRYVRMLEDGTTDDPGFRSLWGFYGGDEGVRTTGVFARIQDLGEQRIRDMDATGIDVQILSLSCPGVQIFAAEEGCALARASNDELADAIWWDGRPTSWTSSLRKVVADARAWLALTGMGITLGSGAVMLLLDR